MQILAFGGNKGYSWYLIKSSSYEEVDLYIKELVRILRSPVELRRRQNGHFILRQSN